MTDKIDPQIVDDLRGCLEAAFSAEKNKAAIDKALADVSQKIFDDLEWQIKDDLADRIAGWAAEMAQRAVEALLEGNDDQMRRYLSCEKRADDGTYKGWTGRSDSEYWGRQKEAHEWHSVIHGRLFETGAVALREKIVNAHRELLVTERILDLEDQVTSLVDQVNRAIREKDAMWERTRHLA